MAAVQEAVGDKAGPDKKESDFPLAVKAYQGKSAHAERQYSCNPLDGSQQADGYMPGLSPQHGICRRYDYNRSHIDAVPSHYHAMTGPCHVVTITRFWK